MDWKQEAVEKLQGYVAYRQSLERIPQELEHLKSSYTGIHGAKLDGMPTGRNYNAREDVMLSNINRRDTLKWQLKEAQLWVSIVDGGLSVLDEKDRIVLDFLFIHKVKGSVDEVCYRLNVEKSAVYTRRDKALERFTRALYGAVETT